MPSKQLSTAAAFFTLASLPEQQGRLYTRAVKTGLFRVFLVALTFSYT
jgi:hypothetical protein